ncbi:tetratricopeptide repeat protein [Saccharothrix mutabilis subsp. capreolus]|uniref:tetratricopeptide repeat protein n=3 Tax=Saccharothrix TaxID=2071 RepID=UPI0035EB530C
MVALVAVGAFAARWSLLDWLVASDGTVRNVMEGLSWPATLVALVLALTPIIRRQLGLPSEESGDRGANALGQAVVLDTANPLVGRALHLVDGRLPEVEQVGLLQLRVKPAIDTHSDDGSDLPPYVERDLDQDLEWAIAEGGMVLLHGRAAVGKSRAAVEALRRLRPHDPLLVPRDGQALRELASAGLVPDGAVVWLDDLELYLGTAGLDVALLQRMCPSGGTGRTVVVATMRDEELVRYTTAGTAGSEEGKTIERATVDLIAYIQGRRRIPVAGALSLTERKRAEQMGGRDGRVRRALDAQEGFAEYLAAGTAMMDRWLIGDGPLFLVGQALISAAVDCRRAGYHKPVPTSLLNELHHHYLPPAWRHRDDRPSITEALHWAHQPVLGASSCLQPRSSNTDLASDYLLDRAQAGQSLLPEKVNDALWPALLHVVDPADALPIGFAAYREALPDVAQTAWERAATATTDALTPLGVLLDQQGHTDEAEQLYRRAIDAGHTDALGFLGLLLAQQDHTDEAIEHLQRAIDAGHTDVLRSLGLLLAKQGHTDEAEQLYRRAIDAGHTDALGSLGLLLARQGHTDEAIEHLQRAIDAGHTDVLRSLGLLLAKQGHTDEAEQLYRRAIDAGHTDALGSLGLLLDQQGHTDEAIEHLQRAIDAGHTNALGPLGALLDQQGHTDEAIEHLQRAIDAGDTLALGPLGLLLAKQGHTDEAEQLYRRAIDAGHTLALAPLGLLLDQQGHTDEAEQLYRRAIDAGHTLALSSLGELLAKQGHTDDAIEHFRRAVDAGHTLALAPLGLLLAKQGHTDEAEQLYRRAIDAGHTLALGPLGELLAKQGHTDEAEQLYRRAIDAGHTLALGPLGELLARQGHTDEAEQLYRRAIDAGHTLALGSLGLLLARQGHTDEAIEHLQRAIDAGHTNALGPLGALLDQQGHTDEAEQSHTRRSSEFPQGIAGDE